MSKRSRLVGAALITEALLVVAARLLTFVYVIARETYLADRFRTPLSAFVPWLLASLAVVAVLLWGGVRFRLAPEAPWRSARFTGRVAMIGALGVNAATLVRAVIGFLTSFDRGAQVLVAWALLGLVCGAVCFGMVRTAGFLGSKRPVPGAR